MEHFGFTCINLIEGFVSTMLDWVEGVRSARMRGQMMDLVTFVVFSFCLVLQWPLFLTLALPVMRFVKKIRISRTLSMDFNFIAEDFCNIINIYREE